MAQKQVLTTVKIQIPAGAASPAPPVGTALGPHGVAIMDFCKEYNAKTEDKRGQIIPVEISIYEDRSFTFITKTPPTSYLVREAAGLEKASQNPGREEAGSITWAQVEEIAEVKMPDLNALDIEGAKQQVAGTARSMGISVS
jgi:large subunit ribosomal protein L11